MSELINAKRLGCAQPVILARNALELYDEITIVTDERTAMENLKLLRMHVGYSGMRIKCLVDVTGEHGDVYWIRLRKTRLDGKKPGADS
jgi:hypothetical protein